MQAAFVIFLTALVAVEAKRMGTPSSTDTVSAKKISAKQEAAIKMLWGSMVEEALQTVPLLKDIDEDVKDKVIETLIDALTSPCISHGGKLMQFRSQLQQDLSNAPEETKKTVLDLLHELLKTREQIFERRNAKDKSNLPKEEKTSLIKKLMMELQQNKPADSLAELKAVSNHEVVPKKMAEAIEKVKPILAATAQYAGKICNYAAPLIGPAAAGFYIWAIANGYALA